MILLEWEECQKLLPVDIQMKNEDGKFFKTNKKQEHYFLKTIIYKYNNIYIYMPIPHRD
jgi:hypothetical protein